MKAEFPKSVACVVALVCAAPAVANPPVVSNAWFRALPSNLPAAGYFTLHNLGPALQLKGASSPACGSLMLHRSSEEGGMSSMSMVESVDVPAGGTISFSPGGYHLMCENPSPTMQPGWTVPVTLQFGDGSDVTASFTVKNAAGK